jgi:hypothetical protein
MNTFNPANRLATEPAELPGPPAARKPYHKPAVRYERVFETRALTCGKVQPTQGSCQNNRKNS